MRLRVQASSARRLQAAAGDRVTAYTLEYSVDGVLWSDANGGDELQADVIAKLCSEGACPSALEVPALIHFQI